MLYSDAVARVRQYILETPDIRNDISKVITGGGWDHTTWLAWPSAVSEPNTELQKKLTLQPNQADLDKDDVVRGRPVVLQSKDCHALWVSSNLLEISMPFPEAIDGGVIMRNESGHPTGKQQLLLLNRSNRPA